LALLIGLAVCASSAASQSLASRWELFAEGGASTWNDHFVDSVVLFGNPPTNETLLHTTHIGSSGRLFAGFRFWMNSHEALEASYSYAPIELTESQHCEQVNCGSAWSPSIARAHFFSANYAHAFRVRSRVRPFLTAGIGVMYIHHVAFNGVFQADPLTVNLGGGVDLRIKEHWFLRAEYRGWLFEAPRQGDSSTAATGLERNQVPSLGLVFRF
jgi:opacity protein-like surface antigen